MQIHFFIFKDGTHTSQYKIIIQNVFYLKYSRTHAYANSVFLYLFSSK